MKKRIVSLLLCLALLCSIIPAFAERMAYDYVELKSSKSAHFYTLPSELSYWEDIQVTSYPGRQLDDVPLVRDGKLLIPANYEGAIVLSTHMEDHAISADKASYYAEFTVFVKPASAIKMSAKLVDNAIEVKWQKPINDPEEWHLDMDLTYTVAISNADTDEFITAEFYEIEPAYHPTGKSRSTMTETTATFPLKGRDFLGNKYNIKEGTNLKIEFYAYFLESGYDALNMVANEELDLLSVVYATGSTTLSIPETPVIFKPVTNFNIGRKLDKRNAVGKTVTLVRGVKEKFRIFGVQPSDATEPQFIWKSMNPKVVTVDNNGVITAKKLGTAVIKVKAVNTNVVKSFKIKVVRPADKK